MSDHTRNQDPTRRDFIRLAAASLGGAVLAGASTSCGGIGGGGSGGLGGPIGRAQMPNGYVFYKIFTPGQSGSVLPDVSFINGGVSCTDTNILFYGQKNTGQNGLFQLNINYDGTSAPTISQPIVRVVEGQQMPDGSTVDKIGSAAINNLGPYSTLAVVLTGLPGSSPQFGIPALWQHRAGGSVEALVKVLDPTPNNGRFGAHLGDVAINMAGDIMICADYTQVSNGMQNNQQGAFVLTRGVASNVGSLLSQTGANVQGSSQLPSRLGLCDMDEYGNYVVQAFYSRQSSSRGGDVQTRSGLLGGSGLGPPRVLDGAGSGRGAQGDLFLGPRVANANYSSVIHHTPTQQTLQMNGNFVTRTGDPSPAGQTINGIGPATVGLTGLLYYMVTTTADMELNVSNGVSKSTLLRYGDTIQGGPAIQAIVAGMLADQVDSQNRIVFTGEFADGSQSIIVGIPT